MNYQRHTDLLTSVLEGELVIYDEANGVVHRLNPTARAIWERCDGLHSEREMADSLVETFDVSLEEATVDARQAIVTLTEQQLIEVTEEST